MSKRKTLVYSAIVIAALLFLAQPALAQSSAVSTGTSADALAGMPLLARAPETAINFNSAASVDWVRGELSAQTSFNVAEAGLRLPAGRLRSEDILHKARQGLLRPYLLAIRVDSESTVGDLLERGEISLQELDSFSRTARQTPPSFSRDMSSIIGRYSIPLQGISSFLSSRGVAAEFAGTSRYRRGVELPRPLIPAPAAEYTGIVIIADRELPVRGRRGTALLEPGIFPRIWDTEMNLIYERNIAEAERLQSAMLVRYAAPESIFRPTPSGLDGELAALVGARPLRIFAREVFGVFPTDPVIDRDDALRILSSDNNRRLLREGRVILVLNAATLRT